MNAVLSPSATRPPRLSALAKLPVFFDLRDRPVLVIGGGEPVVWKAELLLAAGARLVMIGEAPNAELEQLATENPRLALVRRAWHEGDLEDVALVVADIEEADEAARLAAAARTRGVPVNVIDKPRFCDFQFGTIVNRSPVVVGIMTDGAAPILGQAIRRRIEAVLPAAVASWARTAQAFRDRLKTLLPGRAERRAFWERFADAALTSAKPEAEQRDALEFWAGEIGRAGGPGRVGEVVIVGAGPGDPELLTLKAMRELQAADVIVYDRLVTPAVLELGRREARRVHVGKEGHGAACRQEDISALLVDLALAGERVVRLKGGDPAFFGRTGEEVEACRAAGIPVRIVPGVTSASAAAASLDLSLTHRDHAGRVQFITAHDRRGDLPADLDEAALADPRSTLVVYMGRRTAGRLAERLLGRGLPATTPVLAVSDASRPTQSHLATTLAELARGVSLPDHSPVVILIGAALGQTGRTPDAAIRATAEPAAAAPA
ncbi:siroheme synthase CysG [uncultured Enterovirga sp.]|uniref:siroheme synthase CysG n=1 Tax=uncultured Enterovirga sp. TaxID=2026352 RepID=UPI0035C99265